MGPFRFLWPRTEPCCEGRPAQNGGEIHHQKWGVQGSSPAKTGIWPSTGWLNLNITSIEQKKTQSSDPLNILWTQFVVQLSKKWSIKISFKITICWWKSPLLKKTIRRFYDQNWWFTSNMVMVIEPSKIQNKMPSKLVTHGDSTIIGQFNHENEW